MDIVGHLLPKGVELEVLNLTLAFLNKYSLIVESIQLVNRTKKDLIYEQYDLFVTDKAGFFIRLGTKNYTDVYGVCFWTCDSGSWVEYKV